MKYIVALMAPAFVCGTLEVEAEDEDEARDSSNNGYACGDRVQTHPATDAWMRGDLQIFEEHLYTEQLQVALRAAINAFPRQPGAPRVLLTTFPSEQHGIGLLMVEAMMVPEGAHCVSLGPQTPIEDIRRASLAHKAHIVALSFSAAFPLRQAIDGLATLRRQLPPGVTLWAGGEMTRRVRKTMPGIVLIPDLASTINALRSWRSHWVPQPA